MTRKGSSSALGSLAGAGVREEVFPLAGARRGSRAAAQLLQRRIVQALQPASHVEHFEGGAVGVFRSGERDEHEWSPGTRPATAARGEARDPRDPLRPFVREADGGRLGGRAGRLRGVTRQSRVRRRDRRGYGLRPLQRRGWLPPARAVSAASTPPSPAVATVAGRCFNLRARRGGPDTPGCRMWLDDPRHRRGWLKGRIPRRARGSRHGRKRDQDAFPRRFCLEIARQIAHPARFQVREARASARGVDALPRISGRGHGSSRRTVEYEDPTTAGKPRLRWEPRPTANPVAPRRRAYRSRRRARPSVAPARGPGARADRRTSAPDSRSTASFRRPVQESPRGGPCP
jgi:hypothetical protein